MTQTITKLIVKNLYHITMCFTKCFDIVERVAIDLVKICKYMKYILSYNANKRFLILVNICSYILSFNASNTRKKKSLPIFQYLSH